MRRTRWRPWPGAKRWGASLRPAVVWPVPTRSPPATPFTSSSCVAGDCRNSGSRGRDCLLRLKGKGRHAGNESERDMTVGEFSRHPEHQFPGIVVMPERPGGNRVEHRGPAAPGYRRERSCCRLQTPRRERPLPQKNALRGVVQRQPVGAGNPPGNPSTPSWCSIRAPVAEAARRRCAQPPSVGARIPSVEYFAFAFICSCRSCPEQAAAVGARNPYGPRTERAPARPSLPRSRVCSAQRGGRDRLLANMSVQLVRPRTSGIGDTRNGRQT